jgi:lipopolysaccharide/colanic/teichoic acid biosynthesis glycosyltransferase
MKIISPGPFLFKQKRLGLHKKEFYIYKIRTMVINADALKAGYKHLNEYSKPIFKIKNDPRYTKIGRILATYGIDELPQFINIIKGNMTLVGPRPLPVDEALAIPNKYEGRFNVLPGIIPPWFSSGKKILTTDKWLDLDLQYARNKSVVIDINIILKGLLSIIRV